MVKKYGSVFYCRFISQEIVFISDSSIVKQLFPQQQSLNRSDAGFKKLQAQTAFKSVFTVGNNNTLSLIFENGESWAKRRKHAQRKLFRTMTNKYVAISISLSYINAKNN